MGKHPRGIHSIIIVTHNTKVRNCHSSVSSLHDRDSYEGYIELTLISSLQHLQCHRIIMTQMFHLMKNGMNARNRQTMMLQQRGIVAKFMTKNYFVFQ